MYALTMSGRYFVLKHMLKATFFDSTDCVHVLLYVGPTTCSAKMPEISIGTQRNIPQLSIVTEFARSTCMGNRNSPDTFSMQSRTIMESTELFPIEESVYYKLIYTLCMRYHLLVQLV